MAVTPSAAVVAGLDAVRYEKHPQLLTRGAPMWRVSERDAPRQRRRSHGVLKTLHKLHTKIVDMLWRASLLAVMLVGGLFALPASAEEARVELCGVVEAAAPELWFKVSLNVGYSEPEALSAALPCDVVPSGEEACSKLPAPLAPPVVEAEDEVPRYVPASLTGEPQRLPSPPPIACWSTSDPDRCHASPPLPTPLELQAKHAHAVAPTFEAPRMQLTLVPQARPRAPAARVAGRLLAPQLGFERALEQPPRH